MKDIMMEIFNLTPGLIFIFGGLIAFFLKGYLHKAFVLLIPILAFLNLSTLTSSDILTVNFLMSDLNFLYVDKLSMVFGYVFVISSFFGFLYGIAIAKKNEYTSALIYIGSALSVVFARDLITLYIFWELMALSSVILILLRGNELSRKAASRYLIVHIVGGLVLLAGILLYINNTGSSLFSTFEIKI
tara:strand:- start:32 stop:595 length:564 start_codon:yes stop_codon:yes gene_type:complete